MGNDSKKSGENNSDSSATNAAADSSPEINQVDAEYANADAEDGKLAKDLEDLRQTLLRRQADFDNYRKRVEKERCRRFPAFDCASDRGLDSGGG